MPRAPEAEPAPPSPALPEVTLPYRADDTTEQKVRALGLRGVPDYDVTDLLGLTGDAWAPLADIHRAALAEYRVLLKHAQVTAAMAGSVFLLRMLGIVDLRQQPMRPDGTLMPGFDGDGNPLPGEVTPQVYLIPDNGRTDADATD